MQIPQDLPIRSLDVETDDVDALAVAQPERRRDYVRLRAGGFRGAFTERSDGIVAVGRERWDSALRVRCARPRSYVAFAAVRADEAASWCGVPFGRWNVVEIGLDWEITTQGPLEFASFAVERSALERAERLLRGGEEPPRVGNRLLQGVHVGAQWLADQVVSAQLTVDLPRRARQSLHSDFLQLAARLRLRAAPSTSRLESRSRRRKAVLRIEAYLDAYEAALPSLAKLCAIAGVGERTLEYAFREQLGLSPVRYLRLRRLNRVRRELRSADPETTRVTDVAMRWGFWQLGRFAVEYRALFGERPSDTLRGATARSA